MANDISAIFYNKGLIDENMHPLEFLRFIEIDGATTLIEEEDGRLVTIDGRNPALDLEGAIYSPMLLDGEFSCNMEDMNSIRNYVKTYLDLCHPFYERIPNAFNLTPFKLRGLYPEECSPLTIPFPNDSFYPSYDGEKFHVISTFHRIKLL